MTGQSEDGSAGCREAGTKKPVSCETGFAKNGGMNGTRTRDLLRDRQTL